MTCIPDLTTLVPDFADRFSLNQCTADRNFLMRRDRLWILNLICETIRPKEAAAWWSVPA